MKKTSVGGCCERSGALASAATFVTRSFVFAIARGHLGRANGDLLQFAALARAPLREGDRAEWTSYAGS
jgi:hypothetical protein